MKANYSDIRESIPESPKWFDEYGVPRYCEFSPRALSNIYAHEAVLAEISCQACKTKFEVAFSFKVRKTDQEFETLAWAIQNNRLHYGDPPNIQCCAPGPSMNSTPHRVIQYWLREPFGKWERHQWLELKLGPEIDIPDFGPST